MKIAAVVLLFAFCAAGVTGSCISPWEEKARSCYLFVEIRKTWEAARAYCKTNGGDLVQIDNKAEDDAMKPAIDKKDKYPTYSGWWIGLKKSGGSWKLLNGDAPTYSNFYKKLDDHDDAMCGVKMIKKWDYKWYNNPCTLQAGKRPFICEKPLNQ